MLPMFVPPVSEVAVSHLPSLVPQPLSARAYAQALSLLAMLLQEDHSQLITFKNNGGVQLLAMLLRRCPPSHLTAELVTVVQQIVEALKDDKELYIACVRFLLFDFSGRRAKTEHAGILERLEPDGTLVTLEGNTGAGSDANGGAVQRRRRRPGLVTGACRPRYNLS